MKAMAKIAGTALAAGGLALGSAAQAQDDKEVTIGYQLMLNPWKVAIAQERFEEATGWEIDWRRFDSGGKVVTALASGDLDLSSAGSSPIATAVNRGVDVELVYILEDMAAAEALVVRDGSGIEEPEDLVGKKIAVPFVSTTHFHALFALEHWGIDTDEVELLNLQPNQVAAAWLRGDIDAAFVWNPALARIMETGEVLITSGELCELGKCTFDGLVAQREFAQENPEFMAELIKVIEEVTAEYRDDPDAWSADSEEAQHIADLSGATVEGVPAALEAYAFPSIDEQISDTWLGGGAEGGATQALQFTSEYLRDQGNIDTVMDDYSQFVNPEYAEAARELMQE